MPTFANIGCWLLPPYNRHGVGNQRDLQHPLKVSSWHSLPPRERNHVTFYLKKKNLPVLFNLPIPEIPIFLKKWEYIDIFE